MTKIYDESSWPYDDDSLVTTAVIPRWKVFEPVPMSSPMMKITPEELAERRATEIRHQSEDYYAPTVKE